MISLSGCARKNADRELARVVFYAQRRIEVLRAIGKMDPGMAGTVFLLTSELDQLCADLKLLKHRDLTPDVAPFSASPVVRVGDEIEYADGVAR